MGWNNSHLHSFEIGNVRYGMHADDYPEDEVDETRPTVGQAIRAERMFNYEYDFGDSWDHEIVVEALLRSESTLKFGVCLDGQNACPPDDCGGVWGYARMLEALADPAHPEHADVIAWTGGPIDPTEFDLVGVNAALQRLR